MDMRMHDNIQYTFDVDEMTLKVNCHDFHCSRLWRMQLIMVCVIKRKKEIGIQIKREQMDLVICIEDNGIGLDTSAINESLRKNELDLWKKEIP